ncbi:MAG: DUF4244 domain-containing protein [Micrococcales bacterium]|nr:DUF4244 domain-containing protein [Micrococcales bacterium]
MTPTARPRRRGANLGRRLADTADAGMATAEYALVTLAAAGFAGLLLAILKGGEVRALLLGIVTRALG